jgi:uncharacterized phage-associated protein
MSSAKDVSTYIIQKSSEPISNLKLQKLLYYVQGWSLALKDKAAFNDRIEAWVHGPVVPAAFYEYRRFGWNPIDVGTATASISQDEMTHIDDVLSIYGEHTATELESSSHEESPWLDARGELDPKAPSKNEITPEAMKKFFTARMNA